MKKKIQIIVAVFFTLLGFYLRFKRLAARDLWGDELNQLANISGPFKPVWQRLLLGELTCFPGEYLLNYPFVAIFGANKWLINIPHYIFTLLGFYFLYLICKKHLMTLGGFIIAFLILCFNGNLVFHAFEFRPYAVLPALSLAAFYFSEIVVYDWPGLVRFKKLGIGLFFICAAGYHAYGLMISGLCLLYFLILKGHYMESLKQIRQFLIFAGLPAVLLFLWYFSGSIVWRYCRGVNIDTFGGYPNPLNDPFHFIRQVFANLMAHKAYGQKHLALGIWIAFLLPHRERFRQIGFFLLMIVLPIILILVSDIHAGYWFLDRQFVWVMPLYAFFLGWCWDAVFLYSLKKIKNL